MTRILKSYGLLAWPIRLLLSASGLFAQAEGDPAESAQSLPTLSLAELAAQADVIALAQVRDTDYRYRRDYPVSGSAYLKVLIPYKVDQPLEIIDIYEFGLRAGECYFPNPSVFEEGRRYLVFLQRDPDDAERYRGLPSGCALEVLVTAENQYALRWPIDGIPLSDELQALATPTTFGDSYAVLEEEDLRSEQRDEYLEMGWIEPGEQEGYHYTRGIDLAAIRSLMGDAGFSDDRHIKRREPE